MIDSALRSRETDRCAVSPTTVPSGAPATTRESKSAGGLELMVRLVQGRFLNHERALEVGISMRANDPFHITEDVLSRFERIVVPDTEAT